MGSNRVGDVVDIDRVQVLVLAGFLHEDLSDRKKTRLISKFNEKKPYFNRTCNFESQKNRAVLRNVIILSKLLS